MLGGGLGLPAGSEAGLEESLHAWLASHAQQKLQCLVPGLLQPLLKVLVVTREDLCCIAPLRAMK